MKKVIERLQAENESLKSKAKKVQRSGVEAENKRLKVNNICSNNISLHYVLLD